MNIRRVLIHSYSVPLRPAWPSAEGPVDARIGSILVLEEEGGRVGRGETAPWPGFGLETHVSSEAALRLAARRLIGLPRDAYLEAAADLPRLAPVAASPCARHAIDLALHDLAAQHANLSIARLLGGSEALDEVLINAAIPRLTASETVTAARNAVAAGYGTIKLKVGGAPVSEDGERVRSVRDAIGPRPRIRIDANQAWSEGEAMEALAALRAFDIEYCEQPVAAEAIDALGRIRAAGLIPIAADEAVRDLATARRILAARAADLLILKPMALGGLHAAREIATLAKGLGVAVVVTSLLESAVGRTGALHLAASLGPTPFAHGVGPAAAGALGARVRSDAAAGVARVPAVPGLGADVTDSFAGSAVLVASDDGSD